MNSKEFEEVYRETIDSMSKLLEVKGGEYAGGDDRLGNFKRGAAHVGVKPLTVLFIYLSKHYDAVATYVRDAQTGVERPRSESIEGRLDDLMNYCLLAKAIIRESGEPKDVLAAPLKRVRCGVCRQHEFINKNMDTTAAPCQNCGAYNLVEAP